MDNPISVGAQRPIKIANLSAWPGSASPTVTQVKIDIPTEISDAKLYFKKIIKTKKIIKIGLAYSFQKVKKIPINDNDMKLDFIITEKNK